MKQDHVTTTYIPWTATPHRSASVYIFIFVIILCFLSDESAACYSRTYFSRQRDLYSSAFIEEETRPQSWESSLSASGPLYYSDLIYNEGGLHKLNTSSRHYLKNVVVKDRRALLMTEVLKQHVTQLALAVYKKWKGKVQLRILKAWMPPAYRYQTDKGKTVIKHRGDSRQAMLMREETFHMAGRAVDFDLIRPKNSKEDIILGVLAQLAFYEAKFSWCRFDSRKFIHCSVKEESAEFNGRSHVTCFPGESRVLTQSGNHLRLSQLRVGDKVLAADTASGQPVFSRVVMFLHKETQTVSTFLLLKTSSNRTLTLSEYHLVYRLRSYPSTSHHDFTNAEAVYAKDVLVGDRLLMITESQPESSHLLRPTVVVGRKFVKRLGVYAPLTETGNVIIDDHLTSCYARIFSERLARWALLPFQVVLQWWEHYISIFPSSTSAKERNPLVEEHVEGIHWYVLRLLNFAETVFPHSWLFPS